ncbi:MAG: FAD-dependent oxidoreductase [Alphaproteobacteria bacterium]|nr:FAD-dependent oxidoreductase [Alphaproteobacteria bacterium]
MTRPRRRVAVIGAGIAGLGAAWSLRETADVTLYEHAPRFGGHSHTVDVDYDGTQIAVDIGFICFNRPNYPNLTGLFRHLGVRTVMTDMSFSVSDPANYEWSSDPLGLFAWKRNMVDPNFLSLISEILRFNNVARRDLIQGAVPEMTLGDYLNRHGFSQTFRVAYLLPMSAAIWSTPEQCMLDYPVGSFIQFFDNHRLMHAIRPIWRTVAEGSRNYVDLVLRDLRDNAATLHAASRIDLVRPHVSGCVEITEHTGRSGLFDSVILAAHSDQSCRMLDRRYNEQRLALGAVRFAPNTAYLHRDPSLMPNRRTAWASWNVLKGMDDRVCVTYWMNRLQKIPGGKPLFVTLNPTVPPAKDKTFGVYEFDHPMYDAPSLAARRAVTRLQGQQGLQFAGAWLGDGFHEAGLRTGLEAGLALGGEVPWAAVLEHKRDLSTALRPGWIPEAEPAHVMAAG